MILFPHAKINLGLYILSKRPDGFHNLETIFYPLPIYDILEIVSSEQTRFLPTGQTVPGNPSENLVMRAYQLLKKNYPGTGCLDIHLFKAIPMGAGLGGGSADAVSFIQLFNRFFDLKISDKELGSYALQLGSDCPFFLQSAPCFASGRGEILEPLALDLSGYSFLLIHPSIQINTTWAFSKIVPGKPEDNLRTSISLPVEDWKHSMHNVFEKPVFSAYPSLEKIKKQLYSAGALYAAMTGSGSTIFGIFHKDALPDVFEVESARITIVH